LNKNTRTVTLLACYYVGQQQKTVIEKTEEVIEHFYCGNWTVFVDIVTFYWYYQKTYF